MVTRKKRPPPPKIPVKRRPFYLREWRKFMGTKAVDLAEAIDVERESYYRLEKNWWTINAGELDIIAETIGVKPSQFWFPPPSNGQERVSLDDLLEDAPEDIQRMAIAAVRGMVGK